VSHVTDVQAVMKKGKCRSGCYLVVHISFLSVININFSLRSA